VRALSSPSSDGTVVLFPTPGALEPEALPTGPPHTLLVIDGTWIQARKMLARNATLRTFPRIGFVPREPGRYRIRREPAPHCLSTIEAVVEVLGRIEQDPARFRPLLRAFEHMVETHLGYKEARPNPYHRARKRRRQSGTDPVREELRARWKDVVVVYGEANAHPRGSDVPGTAELVQLIALRPATGARYAAVIAPRRPLASGTPIHLEIAPETLRAGEAVGDAMARWQAFVRDEDVLCVWGSYTLDLLRAEGDASRSFLDLRTATARRLGGSAGGVVPAAKLLAGTDGSPAAGEGRAGRRIAALAAVIESLSA
jgi:hypothetical protein